MPMPPGAVGQVARDTALDVAGACCNGPRTHARIRSRCCWFRISSQSRHSERTVRTNRSATPLAWGARNGVANDLNPVAAEHLVKTAR